MSDRGTGWTRLGRTAAMVAAVALLAQTLLFLADGLELLAPLPTFEETAAGRTADLTAYYVAWFERQHDIVWDIAVRDVLGPIGYVAVIVLARAFVRTVGDRDPRVELPAMLIQVGALLALLSDLVYLSQLGFWRDAGYAATSPEDMVAIGRASDTIMNLTGYVSLAAYALFATAFVLIGRLCGTSLFPRPRLRILAWVEALTLLAYIVASLGSSDVAYLVVSVVLGVVLTPAVLVLFGRALPETAAVPLEPPRSPSTP